MKEIYPQGHYSTKTECPKCNSQAYLDGIVALKGHPKWVTDKYYKQIGQHEVLEFSCGQCCFTWNERLSPDPEANIPTEGQFEHSPGRNPGRNPGGDIREVEALREEASSLRALMSAVQDDISEVEALREEVFSLGVHMSAVQDDIREVEALREEVSSLGALMSAVQNDMWSQKIRIEEIENALSRGFEKMKGFAVDNGEEKSDPEKKDVGTGYW